MQDFHVIIPARYGASRLPGKPLLQIGGKPMVQWVVEVANASKPASVTVATDDARIEHAVKGFGGSVVLTANRHESGTDRIAETCSRLGLADNTVVVNLQADEPLMPPALITQVAALLQQRAKVVMATLCSRLDAAQFVDPAVVKVVRSDDDIALYFSRAPIPWSRADGTAAMAANAHLDARRHLGIYAYTSGYVQQFALREASPLEQLERLEQLRVLAHGEQIACADAVEAPPAGVDNAADLARVRAVLG